MLLFLLLSFCAGASGNLIAPGMPTSHEPRSGGRLFMRPLQEGPRVYANMQEARMQPLLCGSKQKMTRATFAPLYGLRGGNSDSIAENVTKTPLPVLEVEGGTMADVVTYILQALFGPCLGARSAFQEVNADEARALANLKEAEDALTSALAAENELAEKYTKKKTSAEQKDAERDALVKKIKHLQSMKQVSKLSGTPVPHNILDELMEASKQLPVLDRARARASARVHRVQDLLQDASVNSTLAREHLRDATHAAQQVVPNFKISDNIKNLLNVGLVGQLDDLVFRARGLPALLASISPAKAWGAFVNFSQQHLLPHSKTLALVAVPFVLYSSNKELSQEVISQAFTQVNTQVKTLADPVMKQVKAVEPMLAKKLEPLLVRYNRCLDNLPDPKLAEKRAFVQRCVAEATADPAAFAKRNVTSAIPVIGRAAVRALRALVDGQLVRRVATIAKWPAVCCLVAHDRHMTRKYFVNRALVQDMASDIAAGGDVKSMRPQAGSTDGESGAEEAGDLKGFDKTGEKDAYDVHTMNALIRTLWMNLGVKIEDEITKHISGALQNIPFASLKVAHVKVGQRAPRFLQLKTLATRSEQEIQVMGVLRWVMEDGAGIKVTGSLKQTFVPTSLNIEHFDIELPVWIRLRVNRNWGRDPPAGQLPDPFAHELFTSIVVSAMARPKIVFDVGLAGTKLTGIPALRDALYAVISQTLDKILVAPNKIVIQKAPDNHIVKYPHALGILHCHIVQASDLPAADWSTGQCDPYVKMRLFSKGKGKSEANTKMIEANRFPVYREQFWFPVYNEASDFLELAVWDYDYLTSHDFLGKANLDVKHVIQEVQGTKRIKEWLQLGNNARLEIDYWYERLVDEEPFKQEVKDIKIDDYQYGIGTRVGEDQKTTVAQKLSAAEMKQLELIGAGSLLQVAGEGGFGLMKNPGENKKGWWWSRGKKDMPIKESESRLSEVQESGEVAHNENLAEAKTSRWFTWRKREAPEDPKQD